MKRLIILTLFIALFSIPISSTTKKFTTDAQVSDPVVSYEKDIAPIIKERCSPCHFPKEGKRKPLNTYATVSGRINDIIYRIQLPTDSLEFMPYKSKKPPLSDSQIQMFIDWKAQMKPK